MRAVNPVDVAIRTIPGAWFAPDRRIYWTDMVLSAALGWSAFGVVVVTTGWTRAALLILTAFALYSAVLFIHEIKHLLPSFLYERVHTDHHRPHLYGTDRDPEYVPFGRRSPLVILGYVVVSLLVRRASRSHG